MATDKDYKDQGLTAKGIENARKIDERLESVVDEVTELISDCDPWEVRDFIARCVDATALSDQRVRAYFKRRDRGLGRSSKRRR